MTKFISVHFPKSSGTSFRCSLEKLLQPNELLCDYDDDPADPNSLKWTAPNVYARTIPILPPEVKFVHGHFSPAKYDRIEAIRIVMLRHPIDTILSIYGFWSQLARTDHVGHQLFENFKRDRPPIIDFARHPTLRFLMSRTYFGNFDMLRFSAIGDFSDRGPFFDWITHTSGLRVDASIHENVTISRTNHIEWNSSARIRSILTDVLDEDIRFYERWAGTYISNPSASVGISTRTPASPNQIQLRS